MSGCQTNVKDEATVHATWKYGLVSIPKEMTTDGSRCVGRFASKKNRECLQKIVPDRKYPLIIFMHGCAGPIGPSRNLVTNFRSLGYAVVAPDSFVRLGRKANCAGGGGKRQILSLRVSEIDYALQQIATLEWVDRSRLVLAGFSEGAQAVALYRGDGVFAGYIVMGFGCRRGIGHGVQASGPVLAIQGARDPLSKGRCSVAFRENSASITVPKAEHDVSSYPKTVAALRKFLGTVAPVD
jgi:dienelactone hydrolase